MLFIIDWHENTQHSLLVVEMAQNAVQEKGSTVNLGSLRSPECYCDTY